MNCFWWIAGRSPSLTPWSKGSGNSDFQPAHVRHLLASHIHLDHTGGAWRWAKEFGTKIYANVERRAAPRRSRKTGRKRGQNLRRQDGLLVGSGRDNSRRQSFPSRTALSCDSVPINSSSFTRQVTHSTTMPIGWSRRRTVFAGDVAGVRIRGGPVIPPFPPPDIHLESWKDSLDKIRALKPASLHITHFGRVDDPMSALDALEKRLFSWADWMKQRLLRRQIGTGDHSGVREIYRAATPGCRNFE